MDASKASVEVESTQTLVPWELLTDAGDKQYFTFSSEILSNAVGFQPEVAPNGIVSGLNLVSPTPSTNDSVDVASFTAVFSGVEETISADTIAFTRDATLDYQKFSVIAETGDTLSIIESDPHASAWSNTRGAAGGPPSIPLAAIEVAQIWISDNTAAVVLASEIKESPQAGTQERSLFPAVQVFNFGEGLDANTTATKFAYAKFASVIPTIHGATANAAATDEKPVYGQWYDPVFTLLEGTVDFAEPNETPGTTSVQLHRTTRGGTTQTLNAGSFTIYMEDGITDDIMRLRGKEVLTKYKQNIDADPFVLSLNVLGIPVTRPVDNDPQGAVTLAPRNPPSYFDGV